ncbi:MAG: DUF4159 domain-containing protein [Ancalomicrobiaceae bacterium]|nr:DUF4159 domain-containing protein [Ancalomicrobiaceae bacterium]
MGLLPLGFTAPVLLAALVLLPAIWWLLRFVPPRPSEIRFPPTRLLADIVKTEETPNRSPWWLTLIRLALAGALILALAGPIWRPQSSADAASGPYWLIVDNGWAAARTWKDRLALALTLVDHADAHGRPVALVATADGPAQSLDPASAQEIRSRLQGLEPRPWVPDRAGLLSGLTKSAEKAPPGSIEYLSDGLADAQGSQFGHGLADIAANVPMTLHIGGSPLPIGLVATDNGLKSLSVTAVRAEAGAAATARLVAIDQKGRSIAETDARFDVGKTAATGSFDLPTELRNDIARVEISGEGHVGAVQLLDERWRRRAVGVVSGTTSDLDQPLLSPTHYLEAALEPFADVRHPPGDDLAKSVADLTRANVSVIAMADVGTLVGDTITNLEAWVRKGGVLVRFAGPRLAAIKGGDRLIPVELRQGERSLGGALSWSQPQALASFSNGGPFASLAVPKDVLVSRQVLAEQNPDLNRKTWASLADGTPLVTADRLGNGWVVLFHVTADTSWSNLPLSGSFVEMLRRIVAFSAATAHAGDATPDDAGVKHVLPPLRLLDAYGRAASPSAEAKPIAEGAAVKLVASREHPPGLYGSEDAFVALEPLRPDDTLKPLDVSAFNGASVESYAVEGPTDLKPAVYLAALACLGLDSLAVLFLSGAFARRRRRVIAALAAGFGLAALGLAGSPPASAQPAPASIAPVLQPSADGIQAQGQAQRQIQAQQSMPPPIDKPQPPAAAQTPRPTPDKATRDKAAADRFDREAALGTRLAYVITGNAELDDVSRRGLEGLTRLLSERTALEPAPPLGVDPAKDDLAFFPLLYWPVDARAQQPGPQALARIDTFMKGGGTILFDTRDALSQPTDNALGRTTPETSALRRILAGLDIPELEPVPSDHVLTKSFYLLQSFPGRFDGGQMWVEATPAQTPAEAAERPVRPGDGVSPIIITSNDLAGAWAVTDDGDFLLPTVPPEPRQREMAFRVGVNIVMYTLTGNYKADQVHVPALLERLGQ